jgi:hypothetical protein
MARLYGDKVVQLNLFEYENPIIVFEIKHLGLEKLV